MAAAIGDRRRGEPRTKEWLFSAVETIPECGCWLWKFSKSTSGYGMIRDRGKGVQIHRLSYELHNGPIPVGMDVMHLCDTPSCANPDHLKLGTRFENNRDRFNKRRCYSKLSHEQVRTIMADGRSNADMARIYNVDPSTISDIRRGKRRRLITGVEA